MWAPTEAIATASQARPPAPLGSLALKTSTQGKVASVSALTSSLVGSVISLTVWLCAVGSKYVVMCSWAKQMVAYLRRLSRDFLIRLDTIVAFYEQGL